MVGAEPHPPMTTTMRLILLRKDRNGMGGRKARLLPIPFCISFLGRAKEGVSRAEPLLKDCVP